MSEEAEMRIRELREKRANLIQQAREVAERENRTAEDDTQYDRLLDEVERLDREIEREERRLELERRAAEDELRRQEREGQRGGDASDPNDDESRGGHSSERQLEERAREFRRFLATHDRNGSWTFRALQVSDDSLGGATVRGEQFVTDLIKAVDDLVHVRQMATVIPVTDANSLGVPSLDADPDDAEWTSELSTGSEDTSMRFGKRQLKPSPLAKRIKVSRTLLQRSALPIEQIIRDRLAYKFAVPQEKAFLTGDGANKPLGVFVASDQGIPTSRDVSTGNTATAITFDGLIEAKYALKAQYWPRAVWLFHRDAVKQIAKIKDSNDQYLWQPSVQAGQPDRLLNFPMRVSEFAPNTFAASQYVGILGDWRYYWIADALDMEVQRLVELYAETNEIGFIGRLETDGMPVLPEAFVRVQLAAS